MKWSEFKQIVEKQIAEQQLGDPEIQWIDWSEGHASDTEVTAAEGGGITIS